MAAQTSCCSPTDIPALTNHMLIKLQEDPEVNVLDMVATPIEFNFNEGYGTTIITPNDLPEPYYGLTCCDESPPLGNYSDTSRKIYPIEGLSGVKLCEDNIRYSSFGVGGLLNSRIVAGIHQMMVRQIRRWRTKMAMQTLMAATQNVTALSGTVASGTIKEITPDVLKAAERVEISNHVPPLFAGAMPSIRYNTSGYRETYALLAPPVVVDRVTQMNGFRDAAYLSTYGQIPSNPAFIGIIGNTSVFQMSHVERGTIGADKVVYSFMLGEQGLGFGVPAGRAAEIIFGSQACTDSAYWRFSSMAWKAVMMASILNPDAVVKITSADI